MDVPERKCYGTVQNTQEQEPDVEKGFRGGEEGGTVRNLFRRLSEGCKKKTADIMFQREDNNIQHRKHSDTGNKQEGRRFSLGWFSGGGGEKTDTVKSSKRRGSEGGTVTGNVTATLLAARKASVGRRDSSGSSGGGGMGHPKGKPMLYRQHSIGEEKSHATQTRKTHRPSFMRQHSADSPQQRGGGPGYGRRMWQDEEGDGNCVVRRRHVSHGHQPATGTADSGFISDYHSLNTHTQASGSQPRYEAHTEEEQDVVEQQESAGGQGDGGKEAIRTMGGFWRQMSEGADSVFSSDSGGEPVFTIDMDYLLENDFVGDLYN